MASLETNNTTKNESTPDEAYYDRNLCVQVIAEMASRLGYKTGIKDDPEWVIIYVDLPTGQVSWHIPKKEVVCNIPEYQGKWDGHNLQEKRDRLVKFLQ